MQVSTDVLDVIAHLSKFAPRELQEHALHHVLRIADAAGNAICRTKDAFFVFHEHALERHPFQYGGTGLRRPRYVSINSRWHYCLHVPISSAVLPVGIADMQFPCIPKTWQLAIN